MKYKINYMQTIIKYFIFQIFYVKIFFLFQIITPVLNECDINSPMLKGTSCDLYCSEKELKEETCKIDNEIIKTQWLNNIILIGEENYRYVNFATYLNGDMIIETTNIPGTAKRNFYAIKNNGREFFYHNNEWSYHYSMEGNGIRYEAEIFTVSIYGGNNNKEYLVSVGKGTQYTELYDFDKGQIYQKTSPEFLGTQMINERGAAFNYTIENEKFIIFGYFSSLENNYMNLNNFYLKMIKFISIDIANNNEINYKTQTIGNAFGKSVSCFVTDLNFIVCFYISFDGNYYFYGTITSFDKDLNVLNHVNLPDVYGNEYLFMKCIHLKEEIGIFAYYNFTSPEIFYESPQLLKLYFKKLDNNGNINEYLDYQEFFIVLDKYKFNINNILNDIIKVSNNKICVISTSNEKTILYVVLLDIIGTQNFIIRYYLINIFVLYKHKIFLDMRANLYNNFISLAFSYCPQENCFVEEDLHYSAFMIFSYPNGTDTNLNITDYLLRNNDIKISNITINLVETVFIENNIFGHIFYGIFLKEKNGCDNINFLLAKDESTTINFGETFIDEDENIKFQFKNNEEYNSMNCILKYSYVVTEPPYIEYKKYWREKSGSDDPNYFDSQKGKYEGKTIHYNIVLEKDLTTNCQMKNCELCYKETNICITCLYNYTLLQNDGIIKNKTCYFEEELETEAPSTMVETQKEEKNLEREKEKEIESEIPKEEYNEKEREINKEKENEISKEEDKETNQEEKNIENEKSIVKEENIENEKTIELEKTIENIKTIENEKVKKTQELKSDQCSEEEIIDNKCVDKTMSNEQIDDCYTKFKENYLTKDYDRETTIVKTKNVLFEISTLDNQKEDNNADVSSIDIGECETILKKKYNISNDEQLIILKTDIKSEDLKTTYVQYEIYHPYNLIKLNMSFCLDVKIVVNTPVNLDNETISLYESLNNYGYNLFDSNDPFYNDICTVYTTENGTDVILSDRQNDIFSLNANITLCQFGCQFEFYNVTSKKAKCNCDIQNNSTITNITNINFKNLIITSFLILMFDSNFMVLRCYKEAFNVINLFRNIGRIIMTIILLIYLILLIIYIFKDHKKVDFYISNILKDKSYYIKNRAKTYNEKVNTRNTKKNKNIKNKKIKLPEKKENKKGKKGISSKTNSPPNKKKEKSSLKKKKLKINNSTTIFPDNSGNNLINKKENKININIIPINNINYGKIKKNQKDKKNKKNQKGKKNNTNKDIIKINPIKINIKGKHKISKKKFSIKEKNKKYNDIIYKNMNDYELNSLGYEMALIYDKRTFTQYYFSLLKKKNLILFTFTPMNDYNLITLKISLFLLSFSLYFTINGFFFSDKTMHRIYLFYEDLIYQIPYIIYSSVASSLINIILKLFSLSEKDILTIKQEEKYKLAMQKAKGVKKCLIIKFFIFFLLSSILLLFFWYFISCFCGIYINTQIILIEDTLLSFGISMIYPFLLNLIPGIFRISALRDKNRNKKCLYQFSGFVALI